MAEAMVNCFLQDVQRYRRLKMRRNRRIRSSSRIESADERRIELEFRAWMAWTRRKDDYFLSFDRCCDQLGVEPEWILDGLEIGPEI
jgi:hypothetical protein